MSICGVPVYDWEWLLENVTQQYFIIIADNRNMHYFMKKLLQNQLEIVKDWIPYYLITNSEIDPLVLYECVGKDEKRFERAMDNLKSYAPIVAIYGNCQTVAIKYYLKHNEEFKKQYFVFKLPEMWVESNRIKFELLYTINIWKYIDILFIQNVSNGNKFGVIYASENIIKYTESSCKIYKLTNVFSTVYYPQYDKLDDCESYDKIVNKYGLINFKGMLDYNVAKFVVEGKNIEEIIDIICDPNLFSKQYIFGRFENELEQNKKREMSCDVKICDYIEDNIHKKVLMEANQHPAECVMVELVRRILEILSIRNCSIGIDGGICALGIPGGERVPIYPSVVKALGISQECMNLLYKLPNGKKVSFKEYMRAYIRSVFNIE